MPYGSLTHSASRVCLELRSSCRKHLFWRSAFHLRAAPSLLVHAKRRSPRAHPAALGPAAARNCWFPATYGTAKAVPLRKIAWKTKPVLINGQHWQQPEFWQAELYALYCCRFSPCSFSGQTPALRLPCEPGAEGLFQLPVLDLSLELLRIIFHLDHASDFPRRHQLHALNFLAATDAVSVL